MQHPYKQDAELRNAELVVLTLKQGDRFKIHSFARRRARARHNPSPVASVPLKAAAVVNGPRTIRLHAFIDPCEFEMGLCNYTTYTSITGTRVLTCWAPLLLASSKWMTLYELLQHHHIVCGSAIHHFWLCTIVRTYTCTQIRKRKCKRIMAAIRPKFNMLRSAVERTATISPFS